MNYQKQWYAVRITHMCERSSYLNSVVKVMNEIPDAIHSVEKHLQQLRAFLSGLDDLQKWVTGTREVLTARHTQSATSLDEQDSIIVDPQVCCTRLDFFSCNLF